MAGPTGPSVASSFHGVYADCSSCQFRPEQPKLCPHSQKPGPLPISEPAPYRLSPFIPIKTSAALAIAAIVSPDFPFVLKGRSDDCQPQSNDLDLGVYLFLLQANFYSLSHQHRRGKIIIARTNPSPTTGTLLLQFPRLCSTGIFFLS